MEKKKKLHEAIEEVLKKSNKPLSPIEIADIINKLALYERKDRRAIASSQISARVNNYTSLFNFNNNLVYLNHWEQQSSDTG